MIKQRKSIVIIIIAVILISVLIILFVIKEDKSFKITTIKKDYHYVYSKEQEITFDVIVLTTSKHISILKEELIDNVYLKDNIEKDIYQLFVEDIIDLDSMITFKNNNYFRYCFTFKLSNETDEYFDLNINDAVIELATQDNLIVNLHIGWISLYKVNDFGSNNNELALSYLKGFSISEDGKNKVSGILIGLRNNTFKKIRVTDVYPLAGGLSFNYDNIKEVNNIDIITNKDINLYLDNNHNIYDNYTLSSIQLLIHPGEVKYYIIPLSYNIKKDVSRFGLKLQYTIDDIIKEVYFKDFTFLDNIKITESDMKNIVINYYG